MKVFIDSEFKCHTTNPEGIFREVETDFFEGKCAEFIEGYFIVPIGESLIRSDGTVIHGEIIAPWKDYNELDAAQREYERQMLAEYEALIDELYAEVTE